MSPRFNRQARVPGSTVAQESLNTSRHDDPWAIAAEALRHAEVQAVQSELSVLDHNQLDNMTMNELWALANALGIPSRGVGTERHQLVAAIKDRQFVR
ncbi:MAG TPA: hypothetical protein VHE81_19280 [Lacipirellulaceae bacterium]|nr:hypothetical protein [Lacipirellulaceae bacterium]